MITVKHNNRDVPNNPRNIDSAELPRYLLDGWFMIGEIIETVERVEPALAPIIQELEPIKPVQLQETKKRGRKAKGQ